jgi:poly-gamma-glutamate capsule biosynthesis protein CapA/YwtB (metallophosphatase superfamily)
VVNRLSFLTWAVFVVVYGFVSVACGAQPRPAVVKAGVKSVRLVAVGDINLAGSVGPVMEKKGRGYPFALIRKTLREADIAFGNLECCIATCGEPLPEKQFTFRAHPRGAVALAEAGFDIVSLANNHAWDYGRTALAETVKRVREAGVQTAGAGSNREEAHALTVVKRNGMRVGFLAYLGMLPPLVKESETEPSLAMASVEVITQEVKAARKKVDVLVVSLHAGKEMVQKITARQKAFAQAAIDAGADLVLGHHPHIVQAMVMYRGKPIYYSLGNFVFSASGRGTGALADVTLSADRRVEARLRPLVLAGVQPHFPEPKGKRRKARSKNR